MNRVRCAIYTRKSSEEGLEQDFNSLDAQREACAAYILSQASEGWKLVPEHYDDGGLSGGSLERPALQRLLSDVAQGRIDIIVVYKVDRLTRSLLDFAKLVERFDASEVSFVSVTQSFNTTTSMGRLTLNMLLSFAQFEREVTAERIRDKIAASKAKGMWMGGIPPLGYAPDGRSLAIVEDHAAIVRDIYARYQRLGNARLVADALDSDGIRSPLRTTRSGKTYGGCKFSRGQICAILKNSVYSGKITHKGEVYEGNHKAIISQEQWDAVQARLAASTQGTKRIRRKRRGLLSGLLYDDQGHSLQQVHTNKGAQRYRYYISSAAERLVAETQGPALRIPALEIEKVVKGELQQLLSDPIALLAKAQLEIAPSMLPGIENAASDHLGGLTSGGAELVRKVLDKVTFYPDRIELDLSVAGLAEVFEITAGKQRAKTVQHTIAVSIRRSGHAVKLVHDNGAYAATTAPDPAIVKLLVQARQWWTELSKGEIDIAKLSRAQGVTASWMTRVVRLAFLAPEVVEAILEGRISAGIDARLLVAPDAVAKDWSEQKAKLLPAG